MINNYLVTSGEGPQVIALCDNCAANYDIETKESEASYCERRGENCEQIEREDE